MKALVGLPTLYRTDLLLRLKGFLESVRSPDRAVVIDNGGRGVPIDVHVERPGRNLGVAGSWNLLMKLAFVDGDFDLCVILQDDIIWDAERLEAAKRLSLEHPDVDLLLSPHLFSVQVLRRGIHETVGWYDERFYPGWCEDDDWALRMIQAGRIYQRFAELDPLPGSITGGTEKGEWGVQREKFFQKWGRHDFGINWPSAKYYVTNRGLRMEDV